MWFFFFDLLVVVVLLGVEVCVGSSGFLYAFINRHTHRFNNTKKFSFEIIHCI